MEEKKVTGKRPELLTVLCILTFIGSGVSFLSYSLFAFYHDLILEIGSTQLGDLFNSREEKEVVEIILSLPRSFFVWNAVLFLFSLNGAFLMWRNKKTGFHVYAVSQIMVLIIYKVYLPASPFPFMPAMLTLFFILLYSRFLKEMT